MIVFLCIDYTIWPGWNHRGVYLYSREQEFKVEKKQKIFLIRFLMYAAYFPFIQLNFLSLMASLNV